MQNANDAINERLNERLTNIGSAFQICCPEDGATYKR